MWVWEGGLQKGHRNQKDWVERDGEKRRIETGIRKYVKRVKDKLLWKWTKQGFGNLGCVHSIMEETADTVQNRMLRKYKYGKNDIRVKAVWKDGNGVRIGKKS